MPSQIQITGFTGTTPADVYVSDVYGNNTSLVGTISSPIPPTITYYPLPSIFDLAPSVMIKIIDANGCEEFKIEECL
jgi:hypothetical protein